MKQGEGLVSKVIEISLLHHCTILVSWLPWCHQKSPVWSTCDPSWFCCSCCFEMHPQALSWIMLCAESPFTVEELGIVQVGHGQANCSILGELPTSSSWKAGSAWKTGLRQAMPVLEHDNLSQPQPSSSWMGLCPHSSWHFSKRKEVLASQACVLLFTCLNPGHMSFDCFRLATLVAFLNSQSHYMWTTCYTYIQL